MTFLTDAETQYRFSAGLRPFGFSTRFDHTVADAPNDPTGGGGPNDIYRGRLVHVDGLTDQPDGFEGRQFEAELLPGVQKLTLQSFGYVERGTAFDGGAAATLMLDPAAIAVPLPPGAASAVVTLLGAALILRPGQR